MTSGLDPELVRRALSWRDADPDPDTRGQLDALIRDEQALELSECLAAELDFGTAGLRGAVGPGPARMNRAVVIRAARALAEHWLAKAEGQFSPVIVGYDARLSSRSLAEASAGVFLALGFTVFWFDAPVPTPLVAYAARVTPAAGAVVITASHNPRGDNGLKAYDGFAVQLGSPDDADVVRRRAALPGARAIPCLSLSAAGDRLVRLGAELEARYLADLESALPGRASEPTLRIVYTPIHGVGLSLARRALVSRGHTLEVVAEQAEPDGRFPTTPNPNPEEPGTLDLALDLGQRLRADLVLANDPDADRLAAAVPRDGLRPRVLTGNEIGVLLADFVLSHAPREPKPLLVTSVVSTPLLERVAASHGARFARCLTGFKWIWYAARTLEASESVRFRFGCEEALGYSIGGAVRDKDGIAAATWLAELAVSCKARGETLLDRLAEVHRRHGAWASTQRSLRRPGQAGFREISAMVERLGARPPEQLAAKRLRAVVDYRVGGDSRPSFLPDTPLLELEFEGSTRVLVRPSGTEPKLKIYADVGEALQGSNDSPELALNRADAQARSIADEMASWLAKA